MNILAINPWITDYAAYDFWLKPYGFLILLTYLKKQGFNIEYIDCMSKKISHEKFGRGKFYSVKLKNPDLNIDTPRIYKRYGITVQELSSKLDNKHPDIILLTSSMTYWYGGLIDLCKILKKRFPKIPIILGGVYANLCYEHAKKNIPCDLVFGNNSLEDFFSRINCKYEQNEFLSTLPEYDFFYKSLEYIVLRTTWGCPYRCSFCAIDQLCPKLIRIEDEKIINFIGKYADSGIKDFAFYDDALLYELKDSKKLLKAILKLKKDINFHTPNALHFAFLDEDIACLLKETGFINPHFGLDTLDKKLQKSWGKNKIKKDKLIEKVDLLKKGGFKKGEFSVYLLLGHPNQDIRELRKDIEFLNSLGVKISLSEFSPVPGTEIFNEYCPDLTEPLLQNNSIFSFLKKDSLKDIWEIKNYTKKLNNQLTL